ncbi:hypothetical protein niasHT_005720 [Heterodera trifolii]|uniref:Aminopeptidase n=1 Tax=Heterodera trifolii TaxID=157864 RepID=A0ABD2M1N3_9BILA
MANGSDKFSKLPQLANPSLYQICLSVDLDTCKFKGKETIHLEITKPTNFLTLHAGELEVEKALLKLEDGTVLSDLKRELDTKWTLLTVQWPKEVKPQKAELEFAYSGQLATNMQGFYKSTYKDSAGNEKILASTQFESTYARSAFPCWDEPTYKAEFDIKLEVDKRMTALSNMNVVAEEEGTDGGGTKKLLTFARTPRMSTYLVAFAVGQFEHIEAVSKTGCACRVYTLPGKTEQAKLALKLVAQAVDFFTDWFNFPMPLPKCDVLAVPDFAMGAMENWGLITARESSVLYDPAKSSSSHRQWLTTVMSHEVAHFWFGNLVTMKWWQDLWLKEGFACFMEFLFTAKNYPEFKVWSTFVDNTVVRAMGMDSLRNSHPIEVPIENPNELDEIYDAVTYEKSCSVLRMLFNHLGEPIFQKALRAYLERHQYANADTDDLWQCMSMASDGTDVKALMSSWTQQMGFPLVSVEQRVLEGDRRELRLSQTRFLADGGPDEANNNPIWQVPFSIVTAADPTQAKAKFLLVKAEDTFILEGVKADEWVKVNFDFTSFFRVQYSQEMLNALLNAVKSRQLGVLDRYQLASDLYALVKASRVPISHFLELFNACRDEQDYFVWSAIDSAIGSVAHSLKHLEDGRQLLDRFEHFVCSVVEAVATKLGWEPTEGEDIHVGRLRALLLNRLSQFRHPPTVQMALSKFNALVEKGVEVVPDLRGLIFRAVGATNEPKNIAALKHLLETSNYSQVELACIIALGQCSDLKMLEEIFDYGAVQGKIRDQDLDGLFSGTQMAPMVCCQHFAWQFFKNNVPLLLKKYGSVNNTMFLHCMQSTASGFCSSAMADEVTAFFEKNFDEHSLKILDRPLRQIIESIKIKESLLKNNAPDLEKYLTENRTAIN